MTDAGQRRLDYWIDRFVEHTEGFPTPLIYRRWGAIHTLAGLLERRVWTVTAGRELYPNLFVLLVGPPGVGKSDILREASKMWKSMRDLAGGRKLHVAPDNVTKAKLIKTLEAASTRLVLSDTQLLEYHSLQVVSSEFSVFLPEYDKTFMSVLTQLFDCLDDYSEGRISTGDTAIPNPQLHMIGGTTPGYMATTFPEAAWTMGFSSRLIMVYHGEAVEVDLFGEQKRSNSLWDDLVHDAKLFMNLYGKLEWTPEAIELITSWNKTGRLPVPSHPKLTTYNTRRIIQVIKLCIIASVSRSNELIIREDDVATAIAWLLEAEQFMPEIFKEMGGAQGGTGGLLLDLHHWAMSEYTKRGKPLREGLVIGFLAQRVQYTNQIVPLLQLAIRNGMFEVNDNLWTPKGGQ